MGMYYLIVIFLVLTTFSMGAFADLDANCTYNANCTEGDEGNNEICGTGDTPVCICDLDNDFVRSTVNTELCLKNCGSPSLTTGYIVTTGSGVDDLLEGATATVVCDTDTGYVGLPPEVLIACQANGTWDTPTGCSLFDCGPPFNVTGYSVDASSGTTYGQNATVTCDTDSGWSGSPPIITCGIDTWSAYSGCTFSGGGGGGIVDCGNPSPDTGYIPATPGSTAENGTASVSCDNVNGYTGTAADITCQANGTWTAYSGCTVDCGAPTASTGYIPGIPDMTTQGGTASVSCDTTNGYNGTAADITCGEDGSWSAYSGCTADCGDPTASTGYIPGTPDTTEEDAIATVSCDTDNGYTGTAANITCQSDGTWTDYSGCSGVSEIRQSFSFVTLFGSFVFALMYT